LYIIRHRGVISRPNCTVCGHRCAATGRQCWTGAFNNCYQVPADTRADFRVASAPTAQPPRARSYKYTPYDNIIQNHDRIHIGRLLRFRQGVPGRGRVHGVSVRSAPEDQQPSKGQYIDCCIFSLGGGGPDRPDPNPLGTCQISNYNQESTFWLFSTTCKCGYMLYMSVVCRKCNILLYCFIL